MKIEYSEDVDIVYLRFNSKKIDNSDSITEDLIVDYDANDNVIGLEILSASEKTDLSNLLVLSFKNIMIESA